MQKAKDTESRNQPRQDNPSKAAQSCHEGSAKVAGNSLHVDENDVRDSPQLGTEAGKSGDRSAAGNKK
jgi:hypothetical protein